MQGGHHRLIAAFAAAILGIRVVADGLLPCEHYPTRPVKGETGFEPAPPLRYVKDTCDKSGGTYCMSLSSSARSRPRGSMPQRKALDKHGYVALSYNSTDL